MSEKYSWKTFGAIFFALLMMISASQAANAAGLLFDLKGNPQDLSSYTGKGKWLVVLFWASDCGVCNREAHQYVDFHFTHSDTDASILGISMDGLKNVPNAQGFIKKHDVNFPNLIGEFEDVANMFMELTGAPWYGTPSILIYSPDGKLMVQQAGAVPTTLIEKYIKEQAAKGKADAKGSPKS